MLALCLSISKVFIKTDKQSSDPRAGFRDSLLIWFLLASLAPKLQLHTLAVSLLPSCGKNWRQQELKKNYPSTAYKLNKYRKRQHRADSVSALFSNRSQEDKEEVWLEHSSANWTEMGVHKEKPHSYKLRSWKLWGRYYINITVPNKAIGVLHVVQTITNHTVLFFIAKNFPKQMRSYVRLFPHNVGRN